jgi:hypothetical protein
MTVDIEIVKKALRGMITAEAARIVLDLNPLVELEEQDAMLREKYKEQEAILMAQLGVVTDD